MNFVERTTWKFYRGGQKMRNACGQQGAVIWRRALSLNLSVLKLTFIFKRASFCFVKTQFSLPLVLGLSEGNEAKKVTMEVWCVRVIPWHGEYGSNNVILEFVGVHEDEADEWPVEHTQDKKNLKIFNWLCEPEFHTIYVYSLIWLWDSQSYWSKIVLYVAIFTLWTVILVFSADSVWD